MLKKYGADHFQLTETPNAFRVEFLIPASDDKETIGGAEYPINVRFTVFLPQLEQFEMQTRGAVAARKRSPKEIEAKVQQETDRLWRALSLGVKGKLIMVEEGIETLEKAMYANIVNPATQTTVYEETAPQVHAQYRAIAAGEQPRRSVFMLPAAPPGEERGG